MEGIDDFLSVESIPPLPTSRKSTLRPFDEVVWMACCFVKFCIFEERFDFTMLSGVRLAGPADRAWRELPAESTQLVAKTIDLKAAYKQFPIFPNHRKFLFWFGRGRQMA